jgi:sulfite reductase (NADPH) flavoprotein alpha-component
MSLTIPNTAPFSGAQKMWLKGYLDALNSALMPPATAPVEIIASGFPVTILWGSQTGNSEALGKKLVKVLSAKGHTPTLKDMSNVLPADLTTAGRVFIITSTYGDGEPPDNAASLHSALHAADAPSLTGVVFSVLALGDSSYPDFCKCGHDFHNRMAELGAEVLVPIVECDVDYDEPFARWSKLLDESLSVPAVA